MNNIQLQAIRRSLFLDVKEAVEHVKTVEDRKMSVRAWQKWESGENPVPVDVHCEMLVLAGILEEMRNDGAEYIYYRSLHEYEVATNDSNVVTWRIQQAAASCLILEDFVDNG